MKKSQILKTQVTFICPKCEKKVKDKAPLICVWIRENIYTGEKIYFVGVNLYCPRCGTFGEAEL